MPDYSAILYDVRESVATITLNRPDSANSANEALSAELLDALIRSEENPAIRALVLTTSGRFFCAGADLKSFYTASSTLKSRISFLHVAISRLVRAPFPVIGAINGITAGGGMGLACACDLLIAAESAKFIMAYTRRGLSPDGTTTYFLPRRIGIGRALELAYLNRTLSAREALDWGLVNVVVADEVLAAHAHKLAAELAQGATRAYAAAKRLIHAGCVNTLETQIETNCAASTNWPRRRIPGRQFALLTKSERRCLKDAEQSKQSAFHSLATGNAWVGCRRRAAFTTLG